MFAEWQHLPGYLNPNLLEFGAFKIRYYSVMYLVAFALTYILVMYRIKRNITITHRKRFRIISSGPSSV